MAKASVLKSLQKVNSSKYNELKEYLLQQADDLDFLQTLVTSIHEEPAINPSMNALNDAFNRLRFAGGFETPGRGIKMDTFLYQASKGALDDDDTGAKKGQVVNVIQTEPKAATHSRGARVTAEVVGAFFIDACFAAQRTMEQTNVSS